MYDYNYGYGYGTPSYDTGASLLGGFFASMGLMMLISSAVGILMLISQWKIYKKAGKNGWECLIPIYNIIVLLEIVGLPTWYIALFFVPFANIYAMFKIFIELAHKFGKSTGFGVLTAFFSPICLPILAFGKDNVFEGGNNQVNPTNNMTPPMNNMNPQYNQMNNMNNQYNQNNSMNNDPNGFEPVMFNPTMNTNINQMGPSPVMEPPQTFVNQNTTIPTPVEPIAPAPIVNSEPVVNFNQPIIEPQQPEITTPVTPLVNTIPEVNFNQNITQVNQEPITNNQTSNIQEPVNMINEPQPMPGQTVINNPINNLNQDNNQNM
jgi:hypothetical protein